VLNEDIPNAVQGITFPEFDGHDQEASTSKMKRKRKLTLASIFTNLFIRVEIPNHWFLK